MIVQITTLQTAKDLPLPKYASSQSAGMDLYAANSQDIILKSFSRDLIPTGICIALPEGYEGQVRSRSGLAFKEGIITLNSPGTIDSDYRGEIKVILMNFGVKNFIVKRGMRIAQLIIAQYQHITWQEVDNLSDTQRATGGFGSSGVF